MGEGIDVLFREQGITITSIQTAFSVTSTISTIVLTVTGVFCFWVIYTKRWRELSSWRELFTTISNVWHFTNILCFSHLILSSQVLCNPRNLNMLRNIIFLFTFFTEANLPNVSKPQFLSPHSTNSVSALIFFAVCNRNIHVYLLLPSEPWNSQGDNSHVIRDTCYKVLLYVG